MHDLFGTSFGTANLLKLLGSVIRSLDWLDDAERPDPAGTELLVQIEDLTYAVSVLDDMAVAGRRKHGPARSICLLPGIMVHLQMLWGSVAGVTQECSECVENLQSRLRDVAQEKKNEPNVFGEVLLGETGWYEVSYKTLKLYTETLQVLGCAIDLIHKEGSQDDSGPSSEVTDLSSKLQYQLKILGPKLDNDEVLSTNELRRAVICAKAVPFHLPPTINKHFMVGRSLQSFYTGRDAQLATIKAAFEQPGPQAQKIFVIYGLGGSGKTELALKYAEDHMQSYWGVFFVDASSRKSAASGYAEIAKIGGEEPTERAALHWLSTRAVPWLLIIDNADDDGMQLESLLPRGRHGCILVTTRNPAYKLYGTVGEKSLKLLPMEVKEANDLILKVAYEPEPWSKTLTESAGRICQALGFLPLAIVHAGRAVYNDLCTWSNYLEVYDSHTERIRRARHYRRDRSFSRNRGRESDDATSMNVFSSYEMLYQPMESSDEQKFQDAVQLLHVFSYFHFQDTRLDTLIAAALSPMKEAEAREKSAKQDEEVMRKLAALQTWSKWFNSRAYYLQKYFETPPPLPDALKNPYGLDQATFAKDVDFRIREAMWVLVSRSLVTEQERREGRYSMHPLVHKWMRERPQLSTSQQALWCQISMTILARSIALPPLGDSDEERSRRRGLLPHIVHVRKQQSSIGERLEENRRLRKSIWPVAQAESKGRKADELARLSRVYAERGLFKEALDLQAEVRDFLVQSFGEEHPLSCRITLVLADTLGQLSRTNEAVELQRRVYEIYLKAFGLDHPMTLEVLDKLASSVCYQGRFTEALGLHQKAAEGMEKVHGEDHPTTLQVINNLGRVYLRFLDFEKSAEHHRRAWEGMKKRSEETNNFALECLEDLSTSLMRLGGEERLSEAHAGMEFVFEQRKALGKEHPYALRAMGNLGRVKSAMGDHADAVSLLRRALQAAERHLEPDHLTLIAGKTCYAQVLSHHGRVDEAEYILTAIAEKGKYKKVSGRDGEHPDRIITLWTLVRCLEKQGKYERALQVCDQLAEILDVVGGHGLGPKHRFAGILRDGTARIREKAQGSTKEWDTDKSMLWEL